MLLGRARTRINVSIAKYLDQIKGGRFPVEVLVRGKDAAANEALFVKLTDAIKAAGVSHHLPPIEVLVA
jgi:hypothetical protein